MALILNTMTGDIFSSDNLREIAGFVARPEFMLAPAGSVVNMTSTGRPVVDGESESGVVASASESFAVAGPVRVPDMHGGVLGTVVPGDPSSFVPDSQVAGMDTNGVQVGSQLSGTMLVAGEDLRDQIAGSGVAGGLAPPTSIVGIAIAILRALLGRATVVTARAWGSLPGWAQTALAAIGIGVGTDLAIRGDIPLITLPGQGGDGGGPSMSTGLSSQEMAGHLDIPGVHLGAHVIGSWVANGVTFYRLSDGKLAVQNKMGRWKVWRPKKPIVIMPSGAVNLRTLLRADAVLNRQAKKIARMLNRRTATRTRKPAKPDVVVIEQHGKLVG